MSTADNLRNAAERLAVRGTSAERQHIEQVKYIANAMADQVDAGSLDPFLRHIKTIAQIEFLLQWEDKPLVSWDPSLLNRVVALKLDAATIGFARDALIALGQPEMVIAVPAD
jgi:hypothetical protein